MDMDCITDRLHINGIESRINTGANDLQVDEVVIHSPQDLKTHLVATNGEGVDLGASSDPPIY